MIEYGMYFGKQELYDFIRKTGGVWNDSKERPIFCCLESKEHKGLYWAIPVGNWDHRTPTAKRRINNFMSNPSSSISSCYYHVGNTTVKSIFFISDVIPVIDKFIDREYINNNTSSIHIIKNKTLLNEIEIKLRRILAYEKSNPNYFRQHITDIKNEMLKELENR